MVGSCGVVSNGEVSILFEISRSMVVVLLMRVNELWLFVMMV